MHATIFGFLIPLGKFETEPKPPILVFFLLPLFFDVILDMKFTNLSAALILTPLFFIGKEIFFHYYDF